jgi:hypothetical protein
MNIFKLIFYRKRLRAIENSPLKGLYYLLLEIKNKALKLKIKE